MSFLKEFQAFISKGNVMDLAVGVIIGGAFNQIVSSLVKDIINPVVGFIIGKPDFHNLFWVMKLPDGYTGPQTYEALTKAGATVFGYGAFLTAVIQFLLLSLVIFFIIKSMNTMRERLERKQPPAPSAPAPVPEDIQLLREIRDLMKKNG
ncbi:large conductance mechanosensitive channel protein MscL [Mesosutterella sp. OilRF-GAM-744-9]|uniref:Large-conductance mechanosensitive channel n=1 Tax=Mesosutterella porci TaxID=2915351 RepID=A0ABS9MSU2_9BURK|nr:large conductance mechanosensitive channel protein MscL [Mesosutterella sp. oilRF-744-WT-GAM-9]MCG5031073.1 large conductance mechanosensitive channel protein MscL [Mesosutterella sp. oilRF-744-WT-GAM-9]MCI6531284.1 large conductance mechanosensitive channel protein MscL [Mesosutterella sp.]